MFNAEVENHIEKYLLFWRETPSVNIAKYGNYLLDQFDTDPQITLFVSGMIRMAILTKDSVYRQIATFCFEAARKRGIASLHLLPIKLPPEDGGRSLKVSIENASLIAKEQKKQGKTVGLLHGHYRLLTPGNLANIVLASSQCDVFLLGIERGWRTTRYKEVNPVYKDAERGGIILSSKLADYLIWINRLNYSNKGYTRMVEQISPSIYFGNASDPDWLRKEMQSRASKAGAVYLEINEIKSFSSTDFERGDIQIPLHE